MTSWTLADVGTEDVRAACDGLYYIDDASEAIQALFPLVRVTVDCYDSPEFGITLGGCYRFTAYAKTGAVGRVVRAVEGMADVVFTRASAPLVASSSKVQCMMRLPVEVLQES